MLKRWRSLLPCPDPPAAPVPGAPLAFVGRGHLPVLAAALPFPSLPSPCASCDLAEGSGLVVVSLKDTELSFCVTLFKCLIKLNLA